MQVVLQVNGEELYSSNAIARYIARLRRDSSLCGSSFIESAKVDDWVDWSHRYDVEGAAFTLVSSVVHGTGASQEQIDRSTAQLKSALTKLDSYLLNTTYLVGESVTLADIIVASVLVYPFQFIIDGACK